MSRWIDFPDPTRQHILSYLVDSHAGAGPTRGLANYAAVNRPWQLFFERMTFYHLILVAADLPDFDAIVRGHRTRLVKHILVEFTVAPPENIGFPAPSHMEEHKTISEEVRDLFRTLSAWVDEGPMVSPGLTLELGLVSPFEELARSPLHSEADDAFSNYRINECYSKFLETRHPDAYLPHQDPYTEVLRYFKAPPPILGNPPRSWDWVAEMLVGQADTELDYSSDQTPESRTLPEARVVTDLLIRLRNLYSFSPDAIATMLGSLPQVKDFQWERWRPGNEELDRHWNTRAAAMIGFRLPKSVKTLVLFDESDTDYHNQPARVADARPIPGLVRSVLIASHRLQNLAISFLIDAQDFFEPFWPATGPSGATPLDLDWRCMSTLALTSPAMTSGSDRRVNALLVAAAAAAEKMPNLKVMEVWHRRGRDDAAVFRYSAEDDDVTGINWKGTWVPQVYAQTIKVWKDVAFYRWVGREHMFEADFSHFLPEEVGESGFVFRHLQLRKYILHDVSVKQIEEMK